MKTVVITGSARGFGLEMLKLFRKENFNTVICDVNEEAIKGAITLLIFEKLYSQSCLIKSTK